MPTARICVSTAAVANSEERWLQQKSTQHAFDWASDTKPHRDGSTAWCSRIIVESFRCHESISRLHASSSVRQVAVRSSISLLTRNAPFENMGVSQNNRHSTPTLGGRLLHRRKGFLRPPRRNSKRIRCS